MTFDFVSPHPHPTEEYYSQNLGYVGLRFSTPPRKISPLTAHIEKAEKHMETGNYDAAYTELAAAAERFLSYRERIQSSFNSSIAQLTTLGCRATPPHPKALPLTRLRRALTA